jgi:hypothetical protein
MSRLAHNKLLQGHAPIQTSENIVYVPFLKRFLI